MDATAGIAIGSRRGLGRVKHIETVFLLVRAIYLLTEQVDAADDAELCDWIGIEVSIRREQADFESLKA